MKTTQQFKTEMKTRQPSKVGEARTSHGNPMEHTISADKLAADVDEPSSL
jgi:hypothetical protein